MAKVEQLGDGDDGLTVKPVGPVRYEIPAAALFQIANSGLGGAFQQFSGRALNQTGSALDVQMLAGDVIQVVDSRNRVPMIHYDFGGHNIDIAGIDVSAVYSFLNVGDTSSFLDGGPEASFANRGVVGDRLELPPGTAIDIVRTSLLKYSVKNYTDYRDSVANLPHLEVSSNYSIPAGLGGTTIRVDASAGPVTVIYPSPTNLADGFHAPIRKVDSTSNQVTVQRQGSSIDLAHLLSQGDEVDFVYWTAAGTWVAKSVKIAPLWEKFTTSGTWTKRPLATSVYVECMASGPGGGSGRRGAAGTIRGGGNGASGGTMAWGMRSAADLPATVPVSVGVGGSGGAAVTTDDTNGNAGGPSVASYFGFSADNYRVLTILANPGGQGGTATTNTQATASQGDKPVGQGASASASGGAGVNGLAAFSSGAASGGGLTTANAFAAGGSGRGRNGNLVNLGGATVGAAGGDGAAPPAGFLLVANESGGGGAAGDATTPGGRGGNGGGYGGAGGGGGASVNGQPSGAGGRGADGVVLVRTQFGA
jgi:hypothetical protein